MVFQPKAFSGSGWQIEEIAGLARDAAIKRIGNPDDVGAFLTGFVGVLGGRVVVSRLPTWEEADGGSLVIEPGGTPFEVRLSPTTSPLRDNFTIAHELGHYLLHYPEQNPPNERVVFGRYGSSRLETQANRFAAAFLMPADKFRKVRRQFRDDSTRLAAYFQVSKPAVETRLKYVS